MATAKQDLGALGERLVVQHCGCPRCKRRGTLRTLPANFKCADIICDFCGYLGQVKGHSCADGATPPPKLLGAAWSPQQQRMEAGIYFPLFLVLVANKLGRFSIHYLSADLQTPELFLQREPLKATARKPGWQGFRYNLDVVRDRLVLLAEGRLPRRRTDSSTAQVSLLAGSPS
jgi:type II restriction enzyme